MVSNLLLVRRAVMLLVAVLLMLPSAAAAQTTALFYDSLAGDVVGEGQRRTILPADATFTVQRNSRNGVTATITGSSSAFSWQLSFSGRFQQPLVATTYSGARRYPFANFSDGMSISGNGRVCNLLTGRFRILEVEYATDGTVTRFAVDFEQHCDDSGPGLFGAFRYNSTISTLVPFAGNYPNYRIDFIPLEHGTVTGTNTCFSRVLCAGRSVQPDTQTVIAVPDTGYQFAGWVGDCYGGPRTTVFVNQPKQCSPWFVPIGSPTARTLSFWDSAPGDPIGQGQKHVFAGHNSMLTAFALNGGNALEMTLDHYDRLADSKWFLEFKAPEGQALQAGTRYTGVVRYVTAAGSQAGMEVHGNGRACNTVSGDFLVREIAIGSTGVVERLAIDFRQQCDANPPLIGYIQHNATVVLPTMQFNTNRVFFGATVGDGAFVSSSLPQQVRLTQQGTGDVTWTATANVPWITITPTSGTGPATLTISPQYSSSLGSGTHGGLVHITTRGAANMVTPVSVLLTTMVPTVTSPPRGSFDTPLNGATGVTGSIPVTGWAVDEIGVARVRIMRDRVAGEVPGPPVFIGNAVLVEGARPDIAAANLTPGNTGAGWGYLLLTNMLPNGGNGTYVLHAYADDVEGNTTLLGSKTITCTNRDAVRPFGAIDTPAQGAVISGTTYDNFGWVLSPGTARADVPGGGTVNVFIDGVPVGTPMGWTSRPDLSALFPLSRYAGVMNALAVFSFNPLSLGDGVHTIAWSVTDSQGQGAGIGSRYFTVSQAATGVTAAQVRATSRALTHAVSTEVLAAPQSSGPISGRRGYDLASPHREYTAGADGIVAIHGEELDRFELQVGAGEITGYLRVGKELRPLPIGSRLDAQSGVFTWQPGVAFVGAYDFTFVQWAGGRAVSRQDVRIVLNPKGSGRVGPQVVIDLPAARQVASSPLAQPFVVAGWAADLDAYTGTGIGTLHVWAYPASGGAPIFLGATAYGGTRPDVAAIYGEQFTKSGYGLVVRGLPPGEYRLAVFAYSLVQGGFVPAKTVTVNVR